MILGVMDFEAHCSSEVEIMLQLKNTSNWYWIVNFFLWHHPLDKNIQVRSYAVGNCRTVRFVKFGGTQGLVLE